MNDQTRFVVTITWNGDYYLPGERAEVAADWIRQALGDRDDCPTVHIEPAPDALRASRTEPTRED